MNNKFKTNSRFSVLAEETDLTNVFNKKDKNKRNNQTKNNTIESKNNQTNTNKIDKIDKHRQKLTTMTEVDRHWQQ